MGGSSTSTRPRRLNRSRQSAHVYFYAEGLDSSDLTKELVAEWCCKKARMSTEHMKVGDWRMNKSMGI